SPPEAREDTLQFTMRRSCLILTCVGALACSEASPTVRAPAERGAASAAPTDTAQPADAQAAASAVHSVARVSFTGTAADTKLGAALVTASGDVIYIDGLEAWPEDVAGRSVTATGVLVKRKPTHDQLVDSAGGVSQGTEGVQLVLQGAHWNAATE